MQANINELVHSKKENPEIENYEYPVNYSTQQMRLDIRGERADAAEFEIIKFVDNAYSAGLDRVEILHGKGTGALKKTVKDILKNHDKVKDFYFAPIELGGEGITIVEFE